MADLDKVIVQKQGTDVNGNVVVNATDTKLLIGTAGPDTITIEATGTNLYMVALSIDIPVTSGFFHFTDGAGQPITAPPITNTTNKAATDYAGTKPYFRLKVINGLKIVLTSANGFVGTFFYSKV